MSRIPVTLAACLLALGCRSQARPTPEATPNEAGWVVVPAGAAMLGSVEGEACRRPGEAPHRDVALAYRMQASATEVTQAEFAAAMSFDPSYHRDCPRCPADSVTIDEARKYCNLLSRQAKLEPCYRCDASPEADGVSCRLAQAPASCPGYRLPTSDEWEYLARAHTSGGTHAGPITACMARDDVGDRIAWYKSSSSGWTHPVAALEPNSWGLFDTAGNVYEWVDDSTATSPHDFGLLRGGSWYHNAHHLRAASVLRVPHERRLAYAGFRCVRTLDVEPGAAVPAPTNVDEPKTEPTPSSLRPAPVDVAAIAFTSTDPQTIVPGCADATCVIEHLVREAAAAGAELIVSPEYALAQRDSEPVPTIGDAPRPGLETEAHPLQARFAALADEVDAYVVINLETHDGAGAHFNTVVAFDPDGIVVARHHKFELYGAERDSLTPGHDVSSFDTPFGRVGLLTCADIYGRPHLHDELINGLDARIVAWSAEWTVDGARRWQSSFAHDWKVFLVAANGARGAGEGAGVFGPGGESLERRDPKWPILYARIGDEREPP